MVCAARQDCHDRSGVPKAGSVGTITIRARVVATGVGSPGPALQDCRDRSEVSKASPGRAVTTGVGSLCTPSPVSLPPSPSPQASGVPAGAGMEADGALDPAALERELRAAVAADARRERENDAKLRALRQRVPSYQEFRSGGGHPGRGGRIRVPPYPDGLRRCRHLARCRVPRGRPSPRAPTRGALSFEASILGPLKRQGHPAGFELKPCSERGLS